MPIVKNDDIIGYRTDDGIFCRNCMDKEDLKEITRDEVILESNRDPDSTYFCDECGKPIGE